MAMTKAYSPIITSSELADRLQGATTPRLIDVREPAEFAAGHVPGAVNLPLSRFAAAFQSLPKHEELILICRSGNRSGMAQQFLRAQGYTATRNLIDGMLGWSGPVSTL